MHTIAAYTIRIHDRKIPKVPIAERYHPLDDVRGVDLLDVFDKWHITHKQKHRVVSKKSGDVSFITRGFVKNNREYVGFIDFGETGVSGKIVDISSNQIRLEKKPGHTDPIPLVCHIFIPPKKKTGLVLLQLTRGRGAKEIFAETVNEVLSHSFPDLKVRLDSITYMPLVKEWLAHGQVRKVIVTKNENSAPSDVANSLLGEHIVEQTISPSIKDKFFGPLSQVVPLEGRTGKAPKFRQAMSQIKEQCDKVEMVAVMNGTERRFQLNTDGYPLMRVPLSDSDVSIVEGIPDPIELIKFTRNLSEDFLTTF